MEKQIKRLVTLAKKCGKLLNNADEQTAKEMFITFYRGAPWSDMYAITFGDVEIGFYSTGPEITFPVETTANDLKRICEDADEFLSHLPEGEKGEKK